MGTSQSHNLKSSPNWSAAKRAMTSLANGTDNKPASMQSFSVNLYKEYTFLKSRELEEISRFRVMSWQPF